MSETLSCSLEVPTPLLTNLKAALSAKFYEAGGIEPTNIIRCGDSSYVEVTVDFSGSDLARLICIEWCVSVAFETCGPAPEFKLPSKIVSQRVCEQGSITVRIDIPPTYFACDPADCGNVYMLCVTVTSRDACHRPTPFGGFCKGGPIMVFPAN